MNVGKMAGMAVAVMLLAMVMVSSASAAVIQIQLGGIDLSYNGTNIVDTGTIQNPDPLTNATFIVNKVPVGVDDTGVTLDLYIPKVFNIPVVGGTVSSDIDGSLYLNLGDGKFLSLKLDSVAVTYIPLASTVYFVFAGSSASIAGQQLPYSLSLDDPVSVSFSTQVSQLSTAGVYVSSFVSAGTGEIQGVPEPATLSMLALGGLAMLKRKRR